MRIEFADAELDRLETDPRFTAGLPHEVVRSFRKRMQAIRAASDERIFWESKGLHYEKLRGAREDQRSMRLNKQYRLILRVEDRRDEKIVVIVSVEDYH